MGLKGLIMLHYDCRVQSGNLQPRLKVTGYSLLLRMCGVRLCFTVNSGMYYMCARLWRQLFIAEVTSNRILDWISILRRMGLGSSKSFTAINILFVRYCVFYVKYVGSILRD